jgi:hypothetical protein
MSAHASRTPVEVAQAQLDAYNARDLDTFCAQFAENAQVFELGAPVPATAGLSAIRERYRQLFENSPALHSAVIARVHLGRAVVDLEKITGRMGSTEPFDILAIYEIDGGLIRRVHFARP